MVCICVLTLLVRASPPVGVFLGRYFSSSVLRSLFRTFPICPITSPIPTRCAIIGFKNGRGPVRRRILQYQYTSTVRYSDFIRSSSSWSRVLSSSCDHHHGCRMDPPVSNDDLLMKHFVFRREITSWCEEQHHH